MKTLLTLLVLTAVYMAATCISAFWVDAYSVQAMWVVGWSLFLVWGFITIGLSFARGDEAFEVVMPLAAILLLGTTNLPMGGVATWHLNTYGYAIDMNTLMILFVANWTVGLTMFLLATYQAVFKIFYGYAPNDRGAARRVRNKRRRLDRARRAAQA